MWPVIKKYGKYNIMKIGFLLAVIGNIIVFVNPDHFVIVLIGMFIRSIGAIPSMMFISMMSDVMDKVEASGGHRFDSLGASMNTLLSTIAIGVSQSVILLCINTLGYIAPQNAQQII